MLWIMLGVAAVADAVIIFVLYRTSHTCPECGASYRHNPRFYAGIPLGRTRIGGIVAGGWFRLR